jgi:excisionase family DNA binding protein
MPKLYTAKEAKEELRVSLSMVYQLVDEGRLKAIRIGGRGKRGCIRIPEPAIADFVKGCCAELYD